MKPRKFISTVLAGLMVLSLLPAAVSAESTTSSTTSSKETIESALNLANNADQEWSYDSSADAWVLSVVSAVVSPSVPRKLRPLSVQAPVSVSTPTKHHRSSLIQVTSGPEV